MVRELGSGIFGLGGSVACRRFGKLFGQARGKKLGYARYTLVDVYK